MGMKIARLLCCACLAPALALGEPPRTRNVVLFMTDGLRWQEVFRGADETLMNQENGKVEDPSALRSAFWRDSPQARREALMPFLWSVVARDGQLYGNRDEGSEAWVTNRIFVSYPGYSETFCGFPDHAIINNQKVPNANATVFEWLNAKPEYRGRVAAFGAWDVFPFIFNSQRAGFPVDDSLAPLTFGTITPRIEFLNQLRAETPPPWSGHFDSLLFRGALEWFQVNRPRVLFVGLGETDEWAHQGEYDLYLTAARRADAYIRELWEACQADAAYRGTTTFVITTDHGRGDERGGPEAWHNHGIKYAGSEAIWIGVLGPDTPALGERKNVDPVTQSQVAATLAALLGEDYVAAQPKAAPPIAAAISSSLPK
jgi:hypothetical protein